MIQNQQSMIFSPFMDIYRIVVSKDNLLRKINELIDFSFDKKITWSKPLA